MKISPTSSKLDKAPQARRSQGFSLIEMIGVATVLALLALALTPILIKQFDRIAGEKETAQLKSFAEAFRRGVVKTRSIPGTNNIDWASMIATNLGIPPNQVFLNDRRVARVFLIDPDFRIYNTHLTLTYSQSGSGFSSNASPRLMIVSSISRALPSSVTTGEAPSIGDFSFNNLWNSIEGKLPSGPGWSNWGGKGEDLKIQRLHLEDLFVRLVLNNQDLSESARYSIEGVESQYPVAAQTVFDARFIQGTLLALLKTNGIPAYTEILHDDRSFEFLLRNWRGTEKFLGRTITHPSPIDMQVAADAFRSSQNPYPPPQGGATVEQAYQAMTNYLQAFIFWKNAPPFSYDASPGTLYSKLLEAQMAFKNNQVIQNLPKR